MANPIVRAVLLALVYIVVFILATPGLDGLPVRFLQTEQSIRRVSRDLPEWAVSALSAVSTINRDYRLPVVRKLTPIQRPLRIEQTWRLYGDGPRLVRRMEIRVDDEAIYRSGDPDF